MKQPIILRYVNQVGSFLLSFFKSKKPVTGVLNQKKEIAESPSGEQSPQGLYVNKAGELETLEEWAKRTGMEDSLKNPLDLWAAQYLFP